MRDPRRLEAYLRRDPDAQLYALADLDDPFWGETTWYARMEDGEIRALVLLLRTLRIPIVYAISPGGELETGALLRALAPALPGSFFANLGLGLEAALAERYRHVSHGEHLKMILREPTALESVGTDLVEPLGPRDERELREFYARAYRADERGGRFFESYMLETGCYAGVRREGRLVAAGGLHVLSERFGVAAIGNVVTVSGLRRLGLGRSVTAFVARAALARVPRVGLNVAADNQPALRCYLGLGFAPVLRYQEGVFERR